MIETAFLFAFILGMGLLIYASWRLKRGQPPATEPQEPEPPRQLYVTRSSAKGVKEAVSWYQDHGLKIFYENDGVFTPSTKLLADLWLANVCAQFFEDLKALGISAVHHFGIYNYRVVAGTTKLSKHAQALAVDVSGFVLKDGMIVSVKKDWGKGTKQANILNAVRILASQHFHGILDPDSNDAHKDHFHFELDPDRRPARYPLSPVYSQVPTAMVDQALVEEEQCRPGHDCAEHTA